MLTSEDSKHLCHLCVQQCAEQSLAYGKCADKHLLGERTYEYIKITLWWTPDIKLGGSKQMKKERVCHFHKVGVFDETRDKFLFKLYNRWAHLQGSRIWK